MACHVKSIVRLAPLGLVALLLAGQARADAARGADVFDENCAECHSVTQPLKNKKGPGLYGVIGRAAATVPDFKYSDALIASKLTWTPESLDAYIRSPKAAVPGGKMKFDGLDDAGARQDLIDFLRSPG